MIISVKDHEVITDEVIDLILKQDDTVLYILCKDKRVIKAECDSYADAVMEKIKVKNHINGFPTLIIN
jgi:hypothetical protein